MCTNMFTAGLFIMAPKWKQARCPSKGEWIKGWVFIQWIQKYYGIHNNLKKKKEKLLLPASTCIYSRDIVLSKRKQIQKSSYVCMLKNR